MVFQGLEKLNAALESMATDAEASKQELKRVSQLYHQQQHALRAMTIDHDNLAKKLPPLMSEVKQKTEKIAELESTVEHQATDISVLKAEGEVLSTKLEHSERDLSETRELYAQEQEAHTASQIMQRALGHFGNDTCECAKVRS